MRVLPVFETLCSGLFRLSGLFFCSTILIKRAYPDCKLWTFENEQERCSLYNDAEMRVKLHIVVLVIIITIIISQQSSLMLGDFLFGTEIPNQDIKNISCAQYLCSAT